MQLNRYCQPPETITAESAGMARAWTLIRETQRQLARMMNQVAVVPTLDLTLSDLIHTGPAGNMLIGERLARAALGMVYGQPVDYQAPDLQGARLIEQGAAVELHFAHVLDRLDNLDRAANGFKVEDSAGDVPITAGAASGRRCLGAWRLWLQSRPGAGGYGSGAADPGLFTSAD